ICASDSLIGREAFERSVSFLQKRSKPPPVPETPTVTCAPRYLRPKLSAAACAKGATVLEPSAVTLPRIACPPAIAAPTDASAARAIPTAIIDVRNLFISSPLGEFSSSHPVSGREGGSWVPVR